MTFRKRTVAPLMAAAGLFSHGCGASISTPFMPLSVGNAWTYRFETSPGGRSGEFTLKITARDERGFLMPEPGGTPSWWRVEDGFLVLERPGETVRFFEIPPKPGISWWMKGADGKRYCVKEKGFEKVEVPAGAFPSALRVEMEDEARTKKAVFHFARGAGLVRRESREGGRTVLLELVRFRPAPERPARRENGGPSPPAP